jgi:hypothetical protein
MVSSSRRWLYWVTGHSIALILFHVNHSCFLFVVVTRIHQLSSLSSEWSIACYDPAWAYQTLQ